MTKYTLRRIIFLILTIVVIVILGGVLIWQLQKNMVFFYTPSEVVSLDISKNIWVGGIIEDYEQKEDEHHKIIHIFYISDKKNRVLTEFNGSLPALFREGQGIIVYGKKHDAQIEAMRVAVKHDEVYMTKEKYNRILSKSGKI